MKIYNCRTQLNIIKLIVCLFVFALLLAWEILGSSQSVTMEIAVMMILVGIGIPIFINLEYILFFQINLNSDKIELRYWNGFEFYHYSCQWKDVNLITIRGNGKALRLQKRVVRLPKSIDDYQQLIREIEGHILN